MISNNNQSEISSPFDSNLTTTEILPVSGTGSSLSTIQWIDGSRTYNDLFLNGYDTPNEETITWDLPSSFYVKTLKIQVNNFERETLEIKTGLATSGTVTEGSTVSGSYLSTQACDGSVWR
ncbi:MAG: hypothetical protein EAX96_16065, partial [Candidatus Lokiarchaeota archaeon]|nr:hypothetical protein [Candidatus Lokiarchaeota archaeon]